MKKNLTVLVLLVTLSLLSIPSLLFAAGPGEFPDNPGSADGSSSPGLVVHVNGATDDDSGGDPGDAGDGYGISDDVLDPGNHGELNGIDDSILDEFMLILMSLIQLAL